MRTEERIHQQKQLVETIGLNLEKEGIQPVAGRILALLMVMDKEQYTFDEITEELQISKSAASVGLKILQAGNKIEYITLPGERKRYFRLRRKDPFQLIDHFKEDLKEKKKRMEEIIALKVNSESENCIFFKDLIHMIDFFLNNFELLKKEYLKKN
ncbi:MAG: hypothetical protein R6U19_10300 [Bacteroidales bacterium]